jgi:leader peptidase (prepilin peptidase)/N-methyltransferase
MIGALPIAGAVGALSGACVGSFASTIAVRAGQGEGALTGRSRCDGCHAPLSFAATVPIVSWVQRGGACPACGARISPLHPVGEIAGATTGLAIALTSSSPIQAGLLAIIASALLVAALVDQVTLKLPDVATLAVAATGAGLSWLRSVEDLLAGAIAAAAAFVLLEAVRRAFLAARRKPGLGFGDVKLTAALALWLGTATSWAVALAAATGLLAFMAFRPADGRLPFGPWLALSAFGIGLAREAGLWPAFA